MQVVLAAGFWLAVKDAPIQANNSYILWEAHPGLEPYLVMSNAMIMIHYGHVIYCRLSTLAAALTKGILSISLIMEYSEIGAYEWWTWQLHAI